MATKTRSFGASKREGHDASAYYGRRMVQAEISDDTAVNEPDPGVLDQVYCHSSERMDELPDNSVALMVTSPPYNVGKDYDEDLSLEEYMGLLKRVFTETYRVLQPGGRACVNVANVGRKPYIPLASHVNRLMIEIGYLMRGEIIWIKGKGASGSCAWGSWMSASNPSLRDVHEYVLVFSKGRFDRVVKGENSISRDAFMRDTLSVWEIAPASAKQVGHPAPFPVELPQRLIELYTFQGDLVLDPFCGAGATCVAASETGRHYVGYDIDAHYVELAQMRVRGSATEVATPRGLKTKVTEAVTAVAMAGEHAALTDAMAADGPPPVQNLTAGDWEAIARAYAHGQLRREFETAFANGRHFFEAELAGAKPKTIEWRGGKRTLYHHDIPVDISVNSVYLVSCKYNSKVLRNPSPHALFDEALVSRSRGKDWYQEVAPKEYRALYRACVQAAGLDDMPNDPGKLTREQRSQLKRAFPRRLPAELEGPYRSMARAVAAESARRWSESLRGGERDMLLRLLRISAVDYFMLGMHRGKPRRLKLVNSADWNARYSVVSFTAAPDEAALQPQVNWEAVVREGKAQHTVKGHVEVRWSHGKFCGNPEAKVYLDTPAEDVPGYEEF